MFLYMCPLELSAHHHIDNKQPKQQATTINDKHI